MPTDPVPPQGADGRSEPDPALPPTAMPAPMPPGWEVPGWEPPGAEAGPDPSDQVTVRMMSGPPPTRQQPTYSQPGYLQPTYQLPAHQQPPPTYQQPGGQYPGPEQRPGTPPPAEADRSRAIWPLAAVVAALVLAVAGTSGYWLIQSGRTNSEISRLAADHQRHEQKQQDARTALKNAYAAADLPGKMKDLRAKNTAYTTYLRAWNAQTSENARLDNLHVLQKLESDCLEAIVEYDRAAAGFSEQMLGEQPAQIDMKDQDLNCEADYWTP